MFRNNWINMLILRDKLVQGWRDFEAANRNFGGEIIPEDDRDDIILTESKRSGGKSSVNRWQYNDIGPDSMEILAEFEKNVKIYLLLTTSGVIWE